MPEKQPKETGVQGGKLGRRLVRGGQRLTSRLCWLSRLTAVLVLPALSLGCSVEWGIKSFLWVRKLGLLWLRDPLRKGERGGQSAGGSGSGPP